MTDREVRRAFARVGRGRWSLRPPCTSAGFRITTANAHHPYGRALGINAYLTHAVRDIYLSWRSGHLVGQMVAWRCGARTTMFRLIDEPDSPLCPVCMIERSPRVRAR